MGKKTGITAQAETIDKTAGEKAAETAAEDSERGIVLKRMIGIASFLIFVGLMVLITLKIGIPLVNAVFTGGSGADTFEALVKAHPIRGRLLYIGIQILQVFIAFIPGEAVEIAGGLAFGPWEGLALSMIGVAIGSCVIFLLSKTLGIKFVRLFVSEERLNDLAIIRSDARLNSLVFLLFFIPGTPKDALTYLVGMTRMKLPVFLLISLFARIPSILTSTWGGDLIMSGDYLSAVIIFAVTGLLGAAGMLLYRRFSAKHSAANKENSAENSK